MYLYDQKASSRGTTGGGAVRHILGPAIPWRVAPQQGCLRFTGQMYCTGSEDWSKPRKRGKCARQNQISKRKCKNS